jgi:hypothetical protein
VISKRLNTDNWLLMTIFIVVVVPKGLSDSF